MDIKLTDIKKEHLKEIYNWELDEELQIQTGVEEPRDYDNFKNSYEAYFRGEKINLYLKGIEADGDIIGRIELYKSKEENFLGIIIGNKSYRNKGAGSAALSLFIGDVKKNRGILKLTAEVYEDNPVSLNFFKKNNFNTTTECNYEIFRGKKRKLIVLERNI